MPTPAGRRTKRKPRGMQAPSLKKRGSKPSRTTPVAARAKRPKGTPTGPFYGLYFLDLNPKGRNKPDTPRRRTQLRERSLRRKYGKVKPASRQGGARSAAPYSKSRRK